MSQIVKHKNVLFRINPDSPTVLEMSKNGGSFWTPCCRSTEFTFVDIMDNGSSMLAQTDNGVWESKNGGSFWIPKSR